MTTKKNATEDAQPATPQADTPAPAANPPAGGSYSLDPATGILTLITPSTVQE